MKNVIILFCFIFSCQLQASEEIEKNEEAEILFACNASSKVAFGNTLTKNTGSFFVKYKKTKSLIKGNYFYIFNILDTKINIMCQYPDSNKISKNVLENIEKITKTKNNIYKATNKNGD
jgi:ribosomal protein L23